jgi:hypothetical protein
VIAALTDLK